MVKSSRSKKSSSAKSVSPLKVKRRGRPRKSSKKSACKFGKKLSGGCKKKSGPKRSRKSKSRSARKSKSRSARKSKSRSARKSPCEFGRKVTGKRGCKKKSGPKRTPGRPKSS